MGQTAVVSPQIIDSTQIGRDLITAASQAAAQATIGVTPFDVDADHDWGGFNTFEFLATFEGGINTTAITSAANIVTTMPSGGQGQYYFGANPIYLMSATEFRPAEVGTSAALGAATRRWTDVYSVDGNFSGTVTAVNGTKTASFSEVGSAAGYPRAGFLLGDTSLQNVALWVAPEGTEQKPSTIEALTNSDTSLAPTKRAGLRASSNESVIYSGYGNGTAGDTPLRIRPNGLNGDWTLQFYQDNATFNCNVGVDGNLTSEVGGSYRLYNLGDESAADQEYLDISATASVYKIAPLRTGAGAVRQFQLDGCYGANFGNLYFDTFGQVNLRFGTSSRISIKSTGTELWAGMFPNSTLADTLSLGKSTARFGEFYSVNGSFTGSLTSEVGGSYRLFNLGSDADVAAGNSEYLEIKFVANECTIHNYATGTGVVRNLAVQASPEGSGIVLGAALGSVSKLFVAEGVPDIMRWQYDGGARLYFRADLEAFDTTVTVGRSTGRYGNVYSVDGSFSGSLTSEVGGSYKLYNLGDESAADQEYLESVWTSNRARIRTQATGAGTVQSLDLFSGNSYVQLNDSNDSVKIGTLASTFTVTNSYFNVNRNFYSTSDANTCGIVTKRWGNVYSVDGDFSGSLTTAGLRTAIGGTLSASATLTTSDHTILCDCQLNNISVNLPSAVGIDGQIFVVKKVDATANFITVFASGAETIDGGSLHIINTQNESIHVQAYSGDWYII